MTRSLHVNEDLRGATLTGSFMYIGNCTLGEKDGKLTTFKGDCTAADYINNTGPADWAQADTYASYWRGNVLDGSKFPLNVGSFHHEVVAEIIRAASAGYMDLRKRMLLRVADYVRTSYTHALWITAYQEEMKEPGATDDIFKTLYREVFKEYPQLLGMFEAMVKNTMPRSIHTIPEYPTATNITLADGQVVNLDAKALPVLPRPNDRYELARVLERQATGEQHLFLYSILPPIAQIMSNPGDWKTYRRAGW